MPGKCTFCDRPSASVAGGPPPRRNSAPPKGAPPLESKDGGSMSEVVEERQIPAQEVVIGSRRLRRGDRVVVRSPEEILKTLDGDGTLHGLPFMPEMLDWCGRTFSVERRVAKTCVALAPSVYPNRRFAEDDVVVLAGPRCDGSGHDGCKRSCKILWKEAWLRPVESDEAPAPPTAAGRAACLARLKTMSDATHYFCQTTALPQATEPFPGKKKLWMLRVALREIRDGDRTLPELLRMLVLWCWQRLVRKVHRDRWLAGPGGRTPTASVGLVPGERIRVKSRAEVVATLDAYRSNRGLGVCHEMTRCYGAEAEVRQRIDRIIDEKTALMRELRNTVSLQNVKGWGIDMPDAACLCFDELGDCPRGEMMFWREIWLERLDKNPG